MDNPVLDITVFGAGGTLDFSGWADVRFNGKTIMMLPLMDAGDYRAEIQALNEVYQAGVKAERAAILFEVGKRIGYAINHKNSTTWNEALMAVAEFIRARGKEGE